MPVLKKEDRGFSLRNRRFFPEEKGVNACGWIWWGVVDWGADDRRVANPAERIKDRILAAGLRSYDSEVNIAECYKASKAIFSFQEKCNLF